MTTRDDDLEPRLGKIGTRNTGLRSRHLRDINRDVARAGRRHGSRRILQGSRIGRAAGVGSVLVRAIIMPRCPPAASSSRRG
jgi:hypothetical protein